MSTVFQSNKVTRKLVQVGKKIRPYGEHGIRTMLIAAFVFVALLEVDQIWSEPGEPGPIYKVWEWVWTTLFAYKTMNFGLGVLTCYLLMRHQRVKHESGIRQSVFKTAPLKLDLETLEDHAKKMGVELHLTNDPRIMRRNMGVQVEEPGDPANPEVKK